MALEVRRMRHVIALAEHGSFARAAAALGMSQPALSRSIQSVEREVGSSLFVRTTRGVEPTDSGHVFVARIRQIVQLTEELDRDIVSERGLQSGRVNVGAGPYPAQSVFADALGRFVADFPRIVVRMLMRDWNELTRRLRAREIEFFVAEISTLTAEVDLDVEPLDAHPMYIFGRRSHPIAGRIPIGLADAFAYPFALLTRIPPRALEPIRALQRRWGESAAGRPVFPALEFDSLDAVRKIVLGSDALMVAPLPCLADELERGRLVVLGQESFLTLRYGIVTLRSQPLTAAGVRLRDYVREAERALTEVEQKLIERWRPRPVSSAMASGHPPPRAPGTSPRVRARTGRTRSRG
jgi:DNA-binding transcriptional LysR family regulator